MNDDTGVEFIQQIIDSKKVSFFIELQNGSKFRVKTHPHSLKKLKISKIKKDFAKKFNIPFEGKSFDSQ